MMRAIQSVGVTHYLIDGGRVEFYKQFHAKGNKLLDLWNGAHWEMCSTLPWTRIKPINADLDQHHPDRALVSLAFSEQFHHDFDDTQFPQTQLVVDGGSIHQVNENLARIAENLHDKWTDMVLTSAAKDERSLPAKRLALVQSLDREMLHVARLRDEKLFQEYRQDLRHLTSIEELAARLGWSSVELTHARATLQDNAREVGHECVIVAHSGRELRTPAPPASVDYLRITQHGFELGYWHHSEWKDAPAEMIAAVLASLDHGQAAKPGEDLSATFDTSRDRQRQRELV